MFQNYTSINNLFQGKEIVWFEIHMVLPLSAVFTVVLGTFVKTEVKVKVYKLVTICFVYGSILILGGQVFYPQKCFLYLVKRFNCLLISSCLSEHHVWLIGPDKNNGAILLFQVNVPFVHQNPLKLVSTTMEPVFMDNVGTITGMKPGPDVTN